MELLRRARGWPDAAESSSQPVWLFSVGFLFWNIDFNSKTKAVSAFFLLLMPVCQHVFACLGVRLLCGPGVSVCECAYRECFSIPASSTSSLIGLQRLTGLAGRLTSRWSSDPTLSTPHPLWGACCYLAHLLHHLLLCEPINKESVVESLAATSLEAFISQLAPIKSLSPPPLLLHSVVDYFRRSHSTLK